ncbi:CRTAC1 family protein [Halorhabdus amylolytica]|uniref:CRTAC1 family protein n=1 Tax=Halorhabdus amylolytica TaxID=2559573 RepID=UPI0010A9EF0C|nr:CRTAC1 family protein [Halorhabdus amylolytica]
MSRDTDRRRVLLAGVVAVLALAALVAVALTVTSSLASTLGTDIVGSGDTDRVAFEETARSCGLNYRTTGNADGSDDGGVFVADVDRDGWPDLLATGGDRPVLFSNTGSGFEPSHSLPAGDYPPLKSALFFDADGDGWEDLLLIPRVGRPIFLGNREGQFRRSEAGFETKLEWGTGASAADYDRDGDLDVYVVQNGDWRNETPRLGTTGQALDGYPNVLFENTDDGFERVENANVEGSRWSLATSFVDLTGDGYPDIHVANDYARDVLLVNQGDGSFDSRPLAETNRHGMASVVRDVNGDGYLDLFVTNIQFPNPQEVWELNSGLNVRNRGNTLLINRGNGTFVERGDAYGVREGGWGWAGAIEDFDNDGRLDLVHASKYYLVRNVNGSFDAVETYPSLWEAQANGTFTRRNASAAGLVPSNGRGLTTFDYDRDGDRDVVAADTSSRFKLYENVNSDGNWLQVDVESGATNALGTRVRVVTNGGETLTRVRSSRSNFFSQSTRTLHFGLGEASVDRLEIVRPDGTEHVLDDVEADRRLVIATNGSVQSRSPRDGDC